MSYAKNAGLFFICLIVITCTKKAPRENNEAVKLDSAKEFYKEEHETIYDYGKFQGIYDHESTTQNFSAILTVTESGDDLEFTLSVSQGTCKGEIKGRIVMISHEENYHVGFYENNLCPLQFSLMLHQDKIDVKEVSLCRLHGNGCAFEGSYTKRT